MDFLFFMFWHDEYNNRNIKNGDKIKPKFLKGPTTKDLYNINKHIRSQTVNIPSTFPEFG